MSLVDTLSHGYIHNVPKLWHELVLNSKLDSKIPTHYISDLCSEVSVYITGALRGLVGELKNQPKWTCEEGEYVHSVRYLRVSIILFIWKVTFWRKAYPACNSLRHSECSQEGFSESHLLNKERDRNVSQTKAVTCFNGPMSLKFGPPPYYCLLLFLELLLRLPLDQFPTVANNMCMLLFSLIMKEGHVLVFQHNKGIFDLYSIGGSLMAQH